MPNNHREGRSCRSVVLVAAATLVCLTSGAPSMARETGGLRGERPGDDQAPNIILILTDDQGWGEVRSHGNPDVETPHMDRLAAEGVRFTQFFVSPLCAPTRAALLTGRYPLRTGVHGVTGGRETMRSEEVTIAEVFGAAGYATGLFGKWHNGAHYPESPNGQGFDEFLGFSAGHWNNYFDANLVRNGIPVSSSGYIADVLTDAAIDFIRMNEDDPFLAYLSYNTPHSPFQVPDAYFDKYAARGLGDRLASVYGMVENLDDNLGRLLEVVESAGLSERTIVMFLTDNGPNGPRYNGNMREHKGSVHDGGLRVPLFIRAPGIAAGGTVVTGIAAHIDLLPTIAELAGVPLPTGRLLDGRSLVPLITGSTSGDLDRLIFAHRFRKGRVELTPGSVRSARWRAANKGSGWELYDIVNDPGELIDVAPSYPEVVSALSASYGVWFDDVTATGFDPIPVQVGHRGSGPVYLPAHEASLTSSAGGGIDFYGGEGWANDWIAHWTSSDASASWTIDVVDAGVFAVSLLYACPQSDIGSRIVVTVGDKAVRTTISMAHDPEPLPSPDRVKRVEVYEKEWAELLAGRLELQPGTAILEVRPELIASGQAMELKAVLIRRAAD